MNRWVWGVLLSAVTVAAPVGAQTSTVSLEDAVRIALDGNRDLRDARLAFEAARGQVREAWGSVMPTVDANATYTRNLSVPTNFLPRIFFDPDADPDELTPVKFGADNTWSFGLQAEQPLFQAAAFLGVGAADTYAELQEESVRARAAAVTRRVRVSYYDVLLAEEAERLSRNTVDRIEQSLKETEAMQRAGLSSEYDVLRLRVELANNQPNLRRAGNAADAARRALAIELDLGDQAALDVEGALADFDFERPIVASDRLFQLASVREVTALDAETAYELALRNRPDVRQAELTEALRRTEVRVERSEYLPRVALFASYTINAQNNGSPDFFGGSDQFRSYGRAVGVRVTMPVFAGLKRPARLQQKEATLEQARTQRDLIVDQVRNEVTTLLAQVDEARERGVGQQLALAQATRGYEIARAQYREGISSPLELTDAEVALRQSEFNYAQAVYDYLTARARLDEALGVTPVVTADGSVTLTLGGSER